MYLERGVKEAKRTRLLKDGNCCGLTGRQLGTTVCSLHTSAVGWKRELGKREGKKKSKITRAQGLR